MKIKKVKPIRKQYYKIKLSEKELCALGNLFNIGIICDLDETFQKLFDKIFELTETIGENIVIDDEKTEVYFDDLATVIKGGKK